MSVSHRKIETATVPYFLKLQQGFSSKYRKENSNGKISSLHSSPADVVVLISTVQNVQIHTKFSRKDLQSFKYSL